MSIIPPRQRGVKPRWPNLATCEEREVSLAEARHHVSTASEVGISVRLAPRGRLAIVRVSRAAVLDAIRAAAKRGAKTVLLAECFGQLVFGL